MTKNTATPEDAAAAQAAVSHLHQQMRSMMSLRNPRGAQLKRQMRAAQAHLNTIEAGLLRSIMAENPEGNDRVTATIIMGARIGIAQREARA